MSVVCVYQITVCLALAGCRVVAVATLENLRVMNVNYMALWTPPDVEAEIEAERDLFRSSLAALHITRLVLDNTTLAPPFFPITLVDLSIEYPFLHYDESLSEPIGALTRLTRLKLNYLDVNLANLTGLTNLRTLSLADNPRTSLVPLAHLTSITSLDLTGMFKQQYVDDSDDDGEDVHEVTVAIPDGLAALTALRTLNLTEIKNLTGWHDFFINMPAHTMCITTKTTYA